MILRWTNSSGECMQVPGMTQCHGGGMGCWSRLGSVLFPSFEGGRLDGHPSFSLLLFIVYWLNFCLMLTFRIISNKPLTQCLLDWYAPFLVASLATWLTLLDASLPPLDLQTPPPCHPLTQQTIHLPCLFVNILRNSRWKTKLNWNVPFCWPWLII